MMQVRPTNENDEMLSIRQAALIALIFFLPVFALIWFCAPWATSRASFEVSDMRALDGILAEALGESGRPTAWLIDETYLHSDGAAKAVLKRYTQRHASVLTEIGEAWDVRLRERVRSLVCLEQLEPWRYRDKTACKWLKDWMKTSVDVARLDVIGERLSITRSDDGLRIDVAFRAADPYLAKTVVDAYGEGLLEHYGEAGRELRREVIGGIEAEFKAMADRMSAREEQVKRLDAANNINGEPDLDLLARFSDALRRARDELPSDERQRLAGEIDAINDVARNELLGRMAGQMSDTDLIDAGGGQDESSEMAPNLLSLLSHPEWTRPPITQLSSTTTDSLSTPTIAVLALFVSLAVGAMFSFIRSIFERRSQRQDNFYASPYANPHWPNMRVVNEAD